MLARLLLVGFVSFALSSAKADDLSGSWQGDSWRELLLSPVESAEDWYTGSFADSTGRSGALNLEWSKLQQRYNGRWKVGEHLTGAITLRVHDSGEVRGAIAIDADAKAPAEMPRLREFTWTRGKAAKLASREPPQTFLNKVDIQAPIKGPIGLAEGITDGAIVKKGQLILSIQNQDPLYASRLEQQVLLAKAELEGYDHRLQNAKRVLEVTLVEIEAIESKVQYHRQVKDHVAAGSNAEQDALAHRLMATEGLYEQRKSKLEATKVDLERAKQLFKEGIESQRTLQEAEQEFRDAEASLLVAKSNLSTHREELVAKRSEGKLKVLKVQMELDEALASLKKAKSNSSKAQADIEKSTIELENARAKVLQAQQKLATQQTTDIRAPIDGKLHLGRLAFHLKAGIPIVVRQGEVICQIKEVQDQQSANEPMRLRPVDSDRITD